MKRLMTIATICVLSAVAYAGSLEWKHSFDDAVKQAKSEKKIVMMDVYTDWCGWCKKLDKDVYTDKDVQAKLAKDFVALKINPEKGSANAKVAKDFGVHSYPHIVFLDGDGKKVEEINGYLPADKFLEVLKKVSP